MADKNNDPTGTSISIKNLTFVVGPATPTQVQSIIQYLMNEHAEMEEAATKYDHKLTTLKTTMAYIDEAEWRNEVGGEGRAELQELDRLWKHEEHTLRTKADILLDTLYTLDTILNSDVQYTLKDAIEYPDQAHPR